MEERLLLWVYLISAVYALVVLYRRRVSPGRRYLAVLLLVGLTGGAGLVWPEAQTPAVWTASGAFVFFLVLPGLFARLARRSAARGRFDRARRYSRVAMAILPVPGLVSEAGLYRTIDEGGGGFHPAAASVQARLVGHRTKSSRVGVSLAIAVLLVHAVVSAVGDSKSVFTLVQLGANSRPLVLDGDYARLLAAQFLHIGWLHLVLNAGALWLLGNWVEPRLGIARTFLVFLVAGTAGNLIGVLAYLGDGIISAGSSGGAMGLLGAALSLHLAKDPADRPPRSSSSLLLVIGATFAIGLLEPGIDNGAHLGGLVTGFLLGLLFVRGPKLPAAATGTAAALGLLAVLASGILVGVRAPRWSDTVTGGSRAARRHWGGSPSRSSRTSTTRARSRSAAPAATRPTTAG